MGIGVMAARGHTPIVGFCSVESPPKNEYSISTSDNKYDMGRNWLGPCIVSTFVESCMILRERGHQCIEQARLVPSMKGKRALPRARRLLKDSKVVLDLTYHLKPPDILQKSHQM